MKRHLALVLSALVLSCVSVPAAQAQIPYAQSRSFSFSGRSGGVGALSGQPTFSPYLNLLRSGNSTLLNYYGLVRPELQFRAANEQFQMGLGQVQSDYQRQFDALPSTQLSESGHRVQFQSNLRGQARLAPWSGAGTPNSYSLSPTGHAVSFGNNGNWFPSGVNRPRQ